MIEVHSLSKRFASLTAVDDISFTVQSGQVLGFLGPNGAGKSTTMKMIAGFLPATEGTVKVCGYDVQEHPVAAKRCLGYLPEGAPGYGEMTPLQFLDFIADMRQLRGINKQQQLSRVIDRLNLDSVLNRPIDNLSKGFKRRVGLAQAIIHDPRVLILDEPTDGLDPNQKQEVRELINAMASDKIIIISTHILEEVQALCNRAIIIANGRLLADDTPNALVQRSRWHNAVTVQLPEPEQARAAIEQLDKVSTVTVDNQRLTAFAKSGAVIFPEIAQLCRQWPVTDLRVESGRLDEVFHEITTREAA